VKFRLKERPVKIEKPRDILVLHDDGKVSSSNYFTIYNREVHAVVEK